MTDLTGGGDHLRAEVVYEGFAGLSRIQQHKLVYDVFGERDRGPDPRPFPENVIPQAEYGSELRVIR